MDQLFLVEIFVDTIYFASSENLPQKKQIIIVATWNNIASLEIRNDGLGGPDESSKSTDIEFASGKSYLFSCNVAKILKSFAECPLEFTIWKKDNITPIGSALINWQSDFVQMVDSCNDNIGYITPVSQRDVYTMKNSSGEETGQLEIFIRLSCFGNSITTQFQVVRQKDPKDGMIKSLYLYKSPNAATTFQCQRYGLGTSLDNIPIGPTLNPTELDDKVFKTFYADQGTVPGSAMPSAFNLEQIIQQRFNRNVADDQLSLMFRLDDNKFITLADILGSGTSCPKFEDLMPIPDEELTVENINNMLCKDKDCPAAKLFKEYGIGPLATGQGLGTLYGNVIPPVTYGLSHANGTMDNYGPYGVFRKPKRPSQDFQIKGKVEKKPKKSKSKSSSIDSGGSYCSCQKKVIRLRGGALTEEKENQLLNEYNNVCNVKKDDVLKKEKKRSKSKKLKKRDGSNDSVNKEVLRLRGGGLSEKIKKNQFNECYINENVLNLKRGYPFDEYLNLYKNCFNFPPSNIIRLRGGGLTKEKENELMRIYNIKEPKITKKSKKKTKKLKKKSSDVSDESSDGSKKCILRLKGGAPIEDNQQPSPVNACRSLMNNFDKLVDAYKKALGPCGQATCPFAQNIIDQSCRAFCPSDPESCPQIPAEIVAARKAPDANSISSCGANTCPYARLMQQPVEPEVKLKQVTPACGEPTCPYTKRRLGISDEEVDEALIQMSKLPKNCGAPTCPYKVEEPLPPIHWDCPDPLPKERCKNPNCPILKQQGFITQMFPPVKAPCQAPMCPYAMPPPCDVPGCPFGPPMPCQIAGCPFSAIPPCTDPSCPINEKILQQDNEVCKDPRCPLFKSPSEGSKASQPCTDPSCPFGRKNSPKFKTVESCPCAAAGSGSRIKSPTISSMEGKNISGPCPCGSGEGKTLSAPEAIGEGAMDILTGDQMEPCTPFTCKQTGGSLECIECLTSTGQPPIDVGNHPTEMVKVDKIEPCTPYTCMATGGSLECVECPCKKGNVKKSASDPKSSKPDKHGDADGGKPKKKKRKKRSRYVLDSGDTYPGVKIGHRYCVTPMLNVPHNMGWLWNVKPVGRMKPRRGWKPGALTKTMLEIIEQHRARSGVKPLVPPVPKPSKRKMRKNAYGVYESDSDVSIPPKPTLQIKKKDGCYFITMNPLKDPYKLEENENPYMECTPMQFKITKNKPPMQIQPGDEDAFCCCSDDDKSSSNSELDIEFTPPAGIIHPDRMRKKKNVVHQDTQYDTGDIPKEESEEKGKGGKKDKKDKKGGKGKGKKGKK